MGERRPPLSYDEVGCTRRTTVLPAGMRSLHLRRRVGGAEVFEDASAFVLGFGMQRGAGLRVESPSLIARDGDDVMLRIGVGPVALEAPTRVVYVIDEPDRCGFAYGTLDGHPECGEEAFLVERADDGTWVEVRAASRPGRWFTRLAGPAGHVAQRVMAGRYLAAVTRAVRAS